MAAAGLFALENVVPKLGEDHKNTRKIAEAINGLKSSIFSVNLEYLHSNILNLNLKDPNGVVISKHLIERLQTITEQEINDGIVDSNGNGIIVKGSFKSDIKIRCVLYSEINDEVTELAIKKILYAMKELEGKS